MGMRQHQWNIASQDNIKRRPQPMSPRRFVMRIDLMGIRPPIWRRIEASSDLTLDTFHVVIQKAFAWHDCHLHEFSRVDTNRKHTIERFLMPYMLADGEEGIPEENGRLGDVLKNPKDMLMYQYDFGDDWEHRICLEEIRDGNLDLPKAICTAGKRAAPPEDCGGSWGYRMMVGAGSDPTHPDHEETAERICWLLGEDAKLNPERFDLDGVNRMLVDLTPSEHYW